MKPGIESARRATVTIAAAIVLSVYWWTAAPAVSQLENPTAQKAYYNLLADGWRAGQLNLKAVPHPALATLKNPYDPVENLPYRLHDVSYYQGKYYLYFGPVPALVLFLPWSELTGTYLWHKQAVAIFASVAFLGSVALLCAIRRRYFPRVGPLAMGFATLVIGLVDGFPVLLRRPDVWEIPIACGAAFTTLALAALWQAVHESRRRIAWIAIAATFYALALGARPSLLPGLVIFAFPIWLEWRERRHALGAATALIAAAVPIAAMGVGLLAFNWARFGSALEFGQRYQLTAVEDPNVRHFGFDFIPYNFRVYFLSPERWQSYFPFVFGIELPPPPPGKLASENPYGVLSNLPIVLLGVLAPIAAFRLTAWRRALGGWIAGVVFMFAGNAFLILCFAGACNRYQVDFLRPLVLLSAIGILAVESGMQDRGALRWFSRAAWGGLSAVSILMALLISFSHWGQFRLHDPGGYSRLARILDRPAAWVESLRGVTHGPLELRLMLPQFSGPRLEPILVSGIGPYYADYFYVSYEDATHIRIGLEHTGAGGPLSGPIPVDYAREHVLQINFGGLYPPAEHPFHRSLPAGEALDLRQKVEVRLDGRLVINTRWDGAYDSSPQTRWIGTNPYSPLLGTRFTGKILGQKTIAWVAKP